jgi:hypothetical protein
MQNAGEPTIGDTIDQTVEKAEEIVRTPLVKRLAQLGFYTKGFIFIVVGAIALLVALGERGGEELTDPQGALERIARGSSYGKIVLIIFVVGAIGHGAWNILRGAADVDDAGKSFAGIVKRIAAVCIGFFYWFLALKAWQLVFSPEMRGETIQKTLTSVLLALPLGALLVGIIGLSIVGVGIQQCYAGISGQFQETFRVREMTRARRLMITILGWFSFVARGLLFGLIGYFFIVAAFEANAADAIGMDGALLALAQSSYGKALLFAAATGLICHGVLSLFEARYRRIC